MEVYSVTYNLETAVFLDFLCRWLVQEKLGNGEEVSLLALRRTAVVE